MYVILTFAGSNTYIRLHGPTKDVVEIYGPDENRANIFRRKIHGHLPRTRNNTSKRKRAILARKKKNLLLTQKILLLIKKESVCYKITKNDLIFIIVAAIRQICL